jgi:uncharacterized protein YdeI (YjbR/CyaY-like superfamily)
VDGEQHFRARLERGDRALGWTIVRVPFDPHAMWPAMVRFRVCGELTGAAGSAKFRTSLFREPGDKRAGGFFLLVNRAMQREAGVALGEEAAFTLRADLEERPAELPEELDALLDEGEGLRRWYGELSEYTRREIGKWIGGVKGEEARLRRAEQMAERLMSAMEAEIELPPLIERAFRGRPKARAGWERMTVAQRRSELLAVFYYQTPEAREKRVAKLVDAAEKRAGK